ncbi:MAG: M23 family metallopeptidase [Fidelibacterota bacterium]|nr:MAG: M23 family metallopeptidase [Candidatus Neomarinimicrobiota bacterium]
MTGPAQSPRSCWYGIPLLFFTLYILLPLAGCARDPGSNDEDDDVRFPLSDYRIWQPFANPNPSFGGRYHCAEDAYGSAGTAVYAIADGMVSYSGPMGGYGWLMIVDHPELNVYSLYGHLSTWREKVTSGDVLNGVVIGYLADDAEDGSGGDYPEWGPHLHFGIRLGSRSDYPDTGDSRWMAGYTTAHPTQLGWLRPSDFMEDN